MLTIHILINYFDIEIKKKTTDDKLEIVHIYILWIYVVQNLTLKFILTSPCNDFIKKSKF